MTRFGLSRSRSRKRSRCIGKNFLLRWWWISNDITILSLVARPSDAKLFYADVEKQIETSTAAALEGFVAMKTKSIHNSVKQWADTAKLGVKSIIGWIRTGGQNNRDIIERNENRERRQFQNEQYKKPRKKSKSRDSTVYSTMKQQSLSGFISLHNDLY